MKCINILLNRLKQESLDALIVSSAANISYLSGVIANDAYLLVSKKETIYFTDSRYTQEVKPKLAGKMSLKRANGSVFELIAKSCLDLELSRVGFEERSLPFAEYKKTKERLKGKAYLVPTYNLVENQRQIKNAEEISKIREALKITAQALDFIKGFIKPGVKELEIAAELERFIHYKGAQGAAFEIIVASGVNSAFAHHKPTQKRLQDGECLLIDMGVECSGYKSDLTRVFFLGKINSLSRKIYEIVLKAQEKAIKKIRPGEEISRIDALSRKYIADNGYAQFFGHSLGHGVGLEIHEAPSVSGKNDALLKAGMVFTVEPAIYLPGKFGIRIEDMILVTEKGYEVLSVAINK
ncbi:MAG: aminopeptidase P family protein [Candidatus Omnitrophica bacterium]|nr:aminopeptidase P family protein [Candidatus Omnitrophota bacterium]